MVFNKEAGADSAKFLSGRPKTAEQFGGVATAVQPERPGKDAKHLRRMRTRHSILSVFLAFTCCHLAFGQSFSPRPAKTPAITPNSVTAKKLDDSIPLTVPEGSPLKVALDREVHIRKVGQPVHGKVVEPVYSFDRLVIPAGSEVLGKIASLEDVSKKRRTLAAMDADFSPSRQVQLDFNLLVMPDGRRLPLQTVVSPTSGGVLQFVPADKKQQTTKKDLAKNAASRRFGEVKKEIKSQWESAKQQIYAPGKMHRLERLAVAQLPYHPQYLDAGTSFNADLQKPLDFGTEALRPATLTEIGTEPPAGSVVRALLVTPLSSATSKKNDPVDAVISQPLMVSDHLVLPEGSHIKGSVLQVARARRMARNGHLRIVFHQVVPPSGIEEKVEASLDGVEVAKGEHLALDAEGGAQVTSPKTRYLTTAIAVMLATSSISPDHDRLRVGGGGGGDVAGGAANGASGFRLVGMIVSAFAHSRVVASGFGAYGAAMQVYSHFLARGRDVVYPKDMSMVIGLGAREKSKTKEQGPYPAVRLNGD
jgi:hypothetical protein